MKRRIAGNPEVDPTLPKVEITLGGKKYFLCFDFGALALAEAKLRDAGVECNLLECLDLTSLDATRIVPLLYGAVLAYQPAMAFEEVKSLVTMRNLGAIFEGIVNAYKESLAEPSDDAQAGPQKPE
jgi:hypothetical protein